MRGATVVTERSARRSSLREIAMTNTPMLLTLGLLLLSSGCASTLRSFEQTLEEAGIARFQCEPGVESPGRAVTVTTDTGSNVYGRGAVVGVNQIMTVEHVVGDAQTAWVATSRDCASGWVRAKVVQRIAAYPEHLLVLQLELDDGLFGALLGFEGFSRDDCYNLGPGTQPAQVVLARGRYTWKDSSLYHGDSGSPVLDPQGRLTGLVTGRRGSESVYTPLPSAEPALLTRRSDRFLVAPGG